MTKLIDEIKHDVSYIKSHTLQPKWYKILKVFIVVGFLVGYYLLFGGPKTLLFAASFFSLALLVHFAYRIGTKKFTQSWLDFQIVEQDGETRTERIGKFYYLAVALSAIIGLAISQILA